MLLSETYLETQTHELLMTFLVAMAPVIELRGAIPAGIASGLPPALACTAAIAGNLVPAPFIIVYIRRIFQWMRRRLPGLNSLVDRLERKAHLKGRTVSKYKYLGLILFVAVPLPGTGAWTGSLAAAFLDMPLRKALPSVFVGVLIAGVAISMLTFGVTSLF